MNSRQRNFPIVLATIVATVLVGGTLGLQDHYTPVRFRNVWVQKIENPEQE